MTIKATVIEHSVSPAGKELITLELEYPRIIHGEFMTHRAFSRNAASSRAIPVRKLLDQVGLDPFVPHRWSSNQAGMQEGAEVSPERREKADHEWRRAAQHAAYFAEALNSLGLAKSICNRLLEPFQWMKTIVTATEWNNFYELRDHADAEPHMQLLAKAILEANTASKPVLRSPDNASAADNWHLPYVSGPERLGCQLAPALLAKISAARCARVSFLNHDGTAPDIQKDVALYQRLAGSRPLHASPLEHQGFPMTQADVPCGNFVGWTQFRKLVEESSRLVEQMGS